MEEMQWNTEIRLFFSDKNVLDKIQHILTLCREVDFFNLKTYDLHGHWSEPLTADHHSPLTGGDDLSPEPKDSVVGFILKYVLHTEICSYTMFDVFISADKFVTQHIHVQLN